MERKEIEVPLRLMPCQSIPLGDIFGSKGTSTEYHSLGNFVPSWVEAPWIMGQ